MTQDYQGPPAPPPPSLTNEPVRKWWDEALLPGGPLTLAKLRHIANRAAAWAWEQAMATLAEREQAAADAELKACCYTLLGQFGEATWSKGNVSGNMTAMVSRLRAARRPKPLSLAEKGLAALVAASVPPGSRFDAIRDALLRLQELEQAATTATTTETTDD